MASKTKDTTNSNTKTGSTSGTVINSPLPGVTGIADGVLKQTKLLGKTPAMDPLQTQGFNGAYRTTNQVQQGLNGNYNNIMKLSQDGGTTADQDTAMKQLRGMATGSGYNATQQRAIDLLNPIASGNGGANPELDNLIKRMSEDQANTVSMSAAGAGRYGSGMHQGALADSTGDISANLRYQDYNTQNARKDSAINSLFGMGTTGYGQKSGAVNDLFNAGQTQRNNVMATTGALQDAYNLKMKPFMDQMDLGQYRKDGSWSNIDRLMQVAQGLGDLGGTTTTKGTNTMSGTDTQQGPSKLGGAIGGALGGYTSLGPLGGLLGGLGGFFG